MVFVLDNYDSFTYNLVQYIGELEVGKLGVGKPGAEPSLEERPMATEIVVRRNDEITPAEIVAMRPDRILLSPGPCTPREAGVLIPLIEHLASLPTEEQIPTLGVCLGHQAIGAAFGGAVVRAGQLMHGRTSAVAHDGRTLFKGLPQPMICTRYHSLIVEESSFPAELEISARVVGDGTIMGLRHRSLPIEGVQFHPESVLTQEGKQLIANFLRRG